MLDIFEFSLVIPFTNAKLVRMFWRMLQVKTGWRNRLNRQCLDALLCIGRSKHRGEFDPNDAINLWFNDKVRRLTAAQDKSCSEKPSKVNENEYADIATLAMPDLEDDDTGFQGFDRGFLHCRSYFYS